MFNFLSSETAPADPLSVYTVHMSGGGGSGGRSAVVGGGGGTVHRERESGAVSDDRKLSVGFC
jgi:hypothetical protein